MELTANWFLGGLSEADLRRIEPRLEPVDFALGQVLCEPGQEIDAVWFFRTGLSSDVYVLEDGFEVEACAFGHESGFGLGAAVGPRVRSFTRDLCQVPGDGWRLPADAFRSALAESPDMLRLVLKHTEALVGFMARSIACNARHPLEARLARWLLTAGDHSAEPHVATTHEFLAIMNGVQRTSVTEQLGSMQQQGLVELRRGRVTISDHEGLKGRACRCYAASGAAWESLRPGSSAAAAGV